MESTMTRYDLLSFLSSRSNTLNGCVSFQSRHRIIILGGLSGRLDQTIHTLSYVQKLSTGFFHRCHSSPREKATKEKHRDVRVVSEDCIAWVLDAVSSTFYNASSMAEVKPDIITAGVS
jgi:thiamine pyrophosphokinase